MKLVTAFIHHVRSPEVVQGLADAGYRNITLEDVKGILKPVSETEYDYSFGAGAMVISETKLSLVCEDADLAPVTAIIRNIAPIGPGISGWVHVSPIDQIWPIEGPRGQAA